MTVYEYGNKKTATVLLQPVDGYSLSVIDNEIAAICDLSSVDFRLIAVKVDSWNEDLSPWKAPPVFGNEGFGDGALSTLEYIAGLCKDSGATYYLGGYSLAGLFSLWAACRTDIFAGIAAVSPSVWFPGFIDDLKGHKLSCGAVYLSLGDKEDKVKNPVISMTGNYIREIYGMLTEQGTDTTLEWNQGNHFKEPDIRVARAFAWLLNNRK